MPGIVWKENSMTVREESAVAKLHAFIEEHNITCVEAVYQCDSINEECVDLVAELVEKILEG